MSTWPARCEGMRAHPLWSDCVALANRVIDDLYRDREEATREEIVVRVLRDGLPPEMVGYFERLPRRGYRRDALVRRVNRMIREAGRSGARPAA